jgi:hypothetical protein
MNDILLNTDYDLKFINGDLFIENSLNQEISLTCLYGEGQLKQYPTYGVDILKFQNGSWSQELKAKIQRMLKEDGFTVNSVNYADNKINIDAIK